MVLRFAGFSHLAWNSLVLPLTSNSTSFGDKARSLPASALVQLMAPFFFSLIVRNFFGNHLKLLLSHLHSSCLRASLELGKLLSDLPTCKGVSDPFLQTLYSPQLLPARWVSQFGSWCLKSQAVSPFWSTPVGMRSEKSAPSLHLWAWLLPWLLAHPSDSDYLELAS